jgi:hypothetical protein
MPSISQWVASNTKKHASIEPAWKYQPIDEKKTPLVR